MAEGRRYRAGVTIVALLLLTAWAGSAEAIPTRQIRSRRASVDTRGGNPNSYSYFPSISADGRYVAFESLASDLVAADGNGFWDVFVRDLVAGTTVRASVDTGGGDPDSFSFHPSISADGQSVAFESLASDLVAGDGNGVYDVFVRDLVAGTTVRASADTGGGDSNGVSQSASISGDGRYAGFHSIASDLVVGDGNGIYDVFVRDLVAGTTVRASLDTEGGDPNGASSRPSVSTDGRYVAFDSYATDLVVGDGPDASDAFLRDLVAGTTVRASVDTSGADSNGDSFQPSVSADGQYMAFHSYATDLVAGDMNGTVDVFVRDLAAGTTERASVDTVGGDPDGVSFSPSISADGHHVAFFSNSTDLIPHDRNHLADVFVRAQSRRG